MTYTNNQTFAIACGLATLLGAMRALGIGLMFDIELPVFYLWDIIMAIAFVLMIKKVRLSFMVATIMWILMFITYFTYISMGTFIPWWTYSEPLYHTSYLVEEIIYIAGIFFAYKSYKELK